MGDPRTNRDVCMQLAAKDAKPVFLGNSQGAAWIVQSECRPSPRRCHHPCKRGVHATRVAVRFRY